MQPHRLASDLNHMFQSHDQRVWTATPACLYVIRGLEGTPRVAALERGVWDKDMMIEAGDEMGSWQLCMRIRSEEGLSSQYSMPLSIIKDATAHGSCITSALGLEQRMHWRPPTRPPRSAGAS